MSGFNPFSQGSNSQDWERRPMLSERLNKFYDEQKSGTQAMKPKQIFSEIDKDCKGRVLIVDDDLFSLSLATEPFLKMKYDVTVAETYQQALNYITECSFDLIILDYVLADATGYDVLKKSEEIMGAIYAKSSVPVITYSTQEQQHILMPELTVFNYLGHWKKPFKRKELYKLVKAL